MTLKAGADHPGAEMTGAPTSPSIIELSEVQWPGFSETGALILPLPRERFLTGPRQLQYRGTAYEAKSEVHVTLLGTAAAKACRETIKRGRTTDRALIEAFTSEHWRIRRTGRFIELAQSDEPRAQRSIIELIELPAMDSFRCQCAQLCGIELPHAPPHVTLYVAGGERGIGVPDDATLERLSRGEVPAEAL